jgi:hypothetical protein
MVAGCLAVCDRLQNPCYRTDGQAPAHHQTVLSPQDSLP